MMTCVILAAGASMRMGRPKLRLTLEGETLLARAIRRCAAYPTVVVTSPALRDQVPATVRFVANGEPDRGMTHSLRLADATIDPAHSILVLPADLPFIESSLVALVANAPGADVTYPVAGGRPAHPVRFAPPARARLASLREGDTLRMLRDDPELTRLIVGTVDPRTQRDIDTEADYAQARA